MDQSRTYLELCQAFREDIGIAGTGPATVVGQTGILGRIVRWIADADITIQALQFLKVLDMEDM